MGKGPPRWFGIRVQHSPLDSLPKTSQLGGGRWISAFVLAFSGNTSTKGRRYAGLPQQKLCETPVILEAFGENSRLGTQDTHPRPC